MQGMMSVPKSMKRMVIVPRGIGTPRKMPTMKGIISGMFDVNT